MFCGHWQEQIINPIFYFQDLYSPDAPACGKDAIFHTRDLSPEKEDSGSLRETCKSKLQKKKKKKNADIYYADR